MSTSPSLYQPSESAKLSIQRRADYICLDYNEPYWGPAPGVRAALKEAIEGKVPLNVYPDVEALDLRLELAKYTGLPPAYIRAYNGSDAALRDIFMELTRYAVFLEEPTYGQVKVFIDIHDNFVTDTPLTADVFYIANPNNPDGRLLTPELLESKIRAASFKYNIWIVDEAYYEYTGVTVAPLVMKYTNLYVVRSFSKAFALTGLRLGYVLTDPKNAARMDIYRNGKDVNSLAQVAGVAALRDLTYMREHVLRCHEIKEYAVSALRKLDYTVTDTPANFFLVHVDDPGAFASYLRENWRILVRVLPSLPGAVRVSVGDMSQMRKFASACKHAIIAGVAWRDPEEG